MSTFGPCLREKVLSSHFGGDFYPLLTTAGTVRRNEVRFKKSEFPRITATEQEALSSDGGATFSLSENESESSDVGISLQADLQSQDDPARA